MADDPPKTALAPKKNILEVIIDNLSGIAIKANVHAGLTYSLEKRVLPSTKYCKRSMNKMKSEE
jgi:hypothetical protein